MPWNYVLNAGAQAASAGASYFLNNESNRKAAELNFEYGEEAADAADQRQRAQYKDFYSMQAQMEQAKAAGFSPSIFFGGSGSVGQTTPSGAQGAGAGGQQGKGMNLQFDLLNQMLIKSQIEKTKAETSKTEQETTNLTSENELIKATTEKTTKEIEQVLAETANTKAQTAQTDLLNEWQELQNFMQGATMQDQINTIKWQSQGAMYEALKMAEETKNLELKNKLDAATLNEQIKAVYLGNQETIKRIAKLASDIELNDETISQMYVNVMQEYERIGIEKLSVKNAREIAEKQIKAQLKIFNANAHNTAEQNKAGRKAQFLNNVVSSVANIIGSMTLYNIALMRQNGATFSESKMQINPSTNTFNFNPYEFPNK